jgi:hypothetical protein
VALISSSIIVVAVDVLECRGIVTTKGRSALLVRAGGLHLGRVVMVVVAVMMM